MKEKIKKKRRRKKKSGGAVFPDRVRFENYRGGWKMILNYTFTPLTVVVALNDGTLDSDKCFPLCQCHSLVLYVCNNLPHISSGM
jgi:hypothetical protein